VYKNYTRIREVEKWHGEWSKREKEIQAEREQRRE